MLAVLLGMKFYPHLGHSCDSNISDVDTDEAGSRLGDTPDIVRDNSPCPERAANQVIQLGLVEGEGTSRLGPF